MAEDTAVGSIGAPGPEKAAFRPLKRWRVSVVGGLARALVSESNDDQAPGTAARSDEHTPTPTKPPRGRA